MGSLPNLHELCNKEDAGGQYLQQKHGHYMVTGAIVPAHLDKNKILKGHQKVFKSRSNGNNTHIYDDMMLEVKIVLKIQYGIIRVS